MVSCGEMYFEMYKNEPKRTKSVKNKQKPTKTAFFRLVINVTISGEEYL